MPRVVVLGTGTAVGKTFVTALLARAAAARWPALSVIAAKPVETGLVGTPDGRPPPGSDASLLEAASRCTTPPRPHPVCALEHPVSPHLAARLAGRSLALGPILAWVEAMERANGNAGPRPHPARRERLSPKSSRHQDPAHKAATPQATACAVMSCGVVSSQNMKPEIVGPPSMGPPDMDATDGDQATRWRAMGPSRMAPGAVTPRPAPPVASTGPAEDAPASPLVFIETAGGVFSPLGPGLTNWDLAVALLPARLLLVAPDALGVLHDVSATLSALAARGAAPDALVLSGARPRDASTGSNAAELDALGIARVATVFEAGRPPNDEALHAVLRLLLAPQRPTPA